MSDNLPTCRVFPRAKRCTAEKAGFREPGRNSAAAFPCGAGGQQAPTLAVPWPFSVTHRLNAEKCVLSNTAATSAVAPLRRALDQMMRPAVTRQSNCPALSKLERGGGSG